jgi:predicted Zn-dependent peptidase
MTEYVKNILANGLRVITIEMPHLHSAEMVCYVGVGSRYEDLEKAGVSHFLEHVLFRGTKEFDSGLKLEKAFEAIGGAVNASVDAETTCFFSRFHPDHLAEACGLFASLLRRPIFGDLEIEREIILEEALEDFNEEGENICLDQLTAALLWPDHPLSRPTIGNRESLQRISRDDLKKHHARFFLPRNTVIAIAGNVRRKDVLAAIESSFGDWNDAAVSHPGPLPLISPRKSPRVAWVRNPDSQVGVQFAFRTPGRNDPRLCALKILRRLLTGGMASLLMQRLREKEGLIYGVEGSLTLFAESGSFSIDLAVAPDKLLRTTHELVDVVQGIVREPINEEEFSRVVKGFLFDLEFSCDQIDEMAGRYGWGEITGCFKALDQERREVLAQSPETLLKAAVDLFSPEHLKVAVVGPFRDSDRSSFEQMLESFSQGSGTDVLSGDRSGKAAS